MADLEYFPENYEDARRRFHDLVARAAGPKTTESWAIPSREHSNLTVDTLYLPPTETPRVLFVILSGVHGLEAYAGHAVQAMTIEEILPTVDRRHAGLYFVHSLNPYGFKNHRRGTENGVNLNRNCATDPALYKFKNPASIALSDRFVPKEPVGGPKSFLLSRMRKEGAQIYFDDVSLDEFVKDSGLGQFESASGLEYGGTGPEPQVQRMISVLQDLIPRYQEIVLLDLHTGLGERARLHLLRGDPPGCVTEAFFRQLFHPEEDRAVYDYTPAESEGFYATLGATNNIFPEIAKAGQSLCAMTMEFGTIGHTLDDQMQSLNLWLLEHQGALYGFATPELGEKVRAEYLEKFFPRDPDWRRQILGTAREFMTRVFRRAGILS